MLRALSPSADDATLASTNSSVVVDPIVAPLKDKTKSRRKDALTKNAVKANAKGGVKVDADPAPPSSYIEVLTKRLRTFTKRMVSRSTVHILFSRPFLDTRLPLSEFADQT